MGHQESDGLPGSHQVNRLIPTIPPNCAVQVGLPWAQMPIIPAQQGPIYITRELLPFHQAPYPLAQRTD